MPAPALPSGPESWWRSAFGSFAAAFGAVLLAVVAVHSGGNWFGAPEAIAIPATAFEVVRGSGHVQDGRLVLDAPDPTGVAILSARVAPFPAERHPRVEVKATAGAGAVAPTLALVWRTREQPSRAAMKPLQWVDGRLVPLELTPADGWSGTVTGIAVLVRAGGPQPLALDGASLPVASAAGALAGVLQQWATRYPFHATSITFPFDAERDDTLPLAVAVAVAAMLAIGAHVLAARRRSRPPDVRVVLAIFVVGWLVLDARWQVNLWRQLPATAEEFAGRTTEEKHLASRDGEYYALLADVNAALPAGPARVFLLADPIELRARGAFFLYPHNVNAGYLDLPPARRYDEPALLRSGDYVLLMLYGGARYDRDAKALVWPDGRRRAVEEIVFKKEGVALLRVS